MYCRFGNIVPSLSHPSGTQPTVFILKPILGYPVFFYRKLFTYVGILSRVVLLVGYRRDSIGKDETLWFSSDNNKLLSSSSVVLFSITTEWFTEGNRFSSGNNKLLSSSSSIVLFSITTEFTEGNRFSSGDNKLLSSSSSVGLILIIGLISLIS